MRTIFRNDYDPHIGDYHERIIQDNARKKTWLFDCDGVYLDITAGRGDITVVNELGDSETDATSQKLVTDELNAVNVKADATAEALTAETEARIQGDATLQQEIDDIKNSPDVVDIVATYADLQAYDTSSLGDKDIIRVLRDETHGGASTYYRWSTATSSFTYIGEVGDYYTKDQTDSLLANKVDKVEGKGLSENDFTDADKAKLDGIEAGAEVNEIDSISVNGATVVPDANKNVDLDIPDSAFVGTDGTTAGAMGLVPAPATTDAGKYLKADGSWSVIPNEILENAGAPTTSTVGVKGQLLIDTTNAKLYQCTAVNNTDPQNPTYTWTEVSGSSVNVVQTTGTSTTDVMSQNAVTSMVFADPSTKRKVAVGGLVSTTSVDGMAIGYGAVATGARSAALGQLSTASGVGSVALPFSTASGQGVIAAGIAQGFPFSTIGYNNSAYRLLTGLYDPQSAHDAATKGYVDTAVASVGADAFTTNEWNALWA